MVSDSVQLNPATPSQHVSLFDSQLFTLDLSCFGVSSALQSLAHVGVSPFVFSFGWLGLSMVLSNRFRFSTSIPLQGLLWLDPAVLTPDLPMVKLALSFQIACYARSVAFASRFASLGSAMASKIFAWHDTSSLMFSTTKTRLSLPLADSVQSRWLLSPQVFGILEFPLTIPVHVSIDALIVSQSSSRPEAVLPTLNVIRLGALMPLRNSGRVNLILPAIHFSYLGVSLLPRAFGWPEVVLILFRLSRLNMALIVTDCVKFDSLVLSTASVGLVFWWRCWTLRHWLSRFFCDHICVQTLPSSHWIPANLSQSCWREVGHVSVAV